MSRIFLLLSLLVFLSCGKEDNTSENPEDLKEKGGNYRLTAMQGEDISSENFVLELDSENQRLSGKTGCNNFISAYQVENKTITFSPPLGTKMYCEGEMEYEETMEKVLPQIKNVKISEEDLVFLSEENKELLKFHKTRTSE